MDLIPNELQYFIYSGCPLFRTVTILHSSTICACVLNPSNLCPVPTLEPCNLGTKFHHILVTKCPKPNNPLGSTAPKANKPSQ